MKIMSDLPVPDNLSPWLVNSLKQATRHVYKYTSLGLVEGTAVYLFHFECSRTGEVRVFGNEIA